LQSVDLQKYDAGRNADGLQDVDLQETGRDGRINTSMIVAIDIGGTFTDLMAFDEKSGRFAQAKSLTTPAQLVQGIVDCLRKSAIDVVRVAELIHGSTTAINTLIERKGAKTGLIVTGGTRDVYLIGRGNRPESYNLFFHRHRPLVPRRLTREVVERMLGSGEVLEPLQRGSVEDACGRLAEEGVEAVAVCFLHSYANPEHERAAGEIVRRALPGAYVSLSHEILREYREFERMSTTVVNAYIGPKVGGYVKGLKSNLAEIGFHGDLTIMQSNGGVMTPEVATERPVSMMESGPVGGIIASAQVGRALGFPNAISFDMGGTTAKASLIRNGEPTMAPGYYVGGYASGHPVMMPVIDVVEVGAGGGSIAWIDEVGALKVGPQSAGAEPGPICYRGGGTQPTITDANLVLGRLDPEDFLGGQMVLDAKAAAQGIKTRISDPLKMGVTAAAQAIVDIAVSKMSLAVREVSVAKGYDPREFALVASGGAGPLHVMAIARELHIPKVIVPLFPAHFSALGMLAADERHDFIRTFYSDLEGADFIQLERTIEEMSKEAEGALRRKKTVSYQLHLDLRYVGQEFTLSVPISQKQIGAGDRRAIRTAFDRMYDRRYAHHSPGEPVEIVNVRFAVIGERPKMKFPRLATKRRAAPSRKVDAYLGDGRKAVSCPVYQRDQLGAGARIAGPALVREHGTTTVLFKGDICVVAKTGELVISVRGTA
jgi:N-methylhydantoinase A